MEIERIENQRCDRVRGNTSQRERAEECFRRLAFIDVTSDRDIILKADASLALRMLTPGYGLAEAEQTSRDLLLMFSAIRRSGTEPEIEAGE